MIDTHEQVQTPRRKKIARTIPFNTATYRPGMLVETRGGDQVVILSTELAFEKDQPVAAQIIGRYAHDSRTQNKGVHQFSEDGRFDPWSNAEHEFDLLMTVVS